MSEADQSVYSYLRSVQQSPLTAGFMLTYFLAVLIFWPIFGNVPYKAYSSFLAASYTIAFWPSAVAGVKGLFGETSNMLVGGPSIVGNAAFHEAAALFCVTKTAIALPVDLYKLILQGRFGASLVGLALAAIPACLFEDEESAWAKPRVALLRGLPQLNKLNKLVPVFMPIFAIAYLGILLPPLLPLLALQLIIKLGTLVHSKRPLSFRLPRLRCSAAQSTLEQLVKLLTPQAMLYGVLQKQPPFFMKGSNIGDRPPPALVIENERDSQVFGSLLKDAADKWAKIAWPGAGSKAAALPACTNHSFRLGLWRYISGSPKIQPVHGEELDLSGNHALLLDHLNIGFVPPMPPHLTTPRHRRVVSSRVGNIFLVFLFLYRVILLSLATTSSILRVLEAIAFPSLSLIFPEMYAPGCLLLNDPAWFARALLGVRYRPFDPKKDRIPPASEILSNPDLQAFFTSFSSLLTLVKRLNISDADFLQHWDAAFDEARKEIDLGLLEHEVGDLILETVLAWKEVKREKEEKVEEAKEKQE